jgi:hypothetical protein
MIGMQKHLMNLSLMLATALSFGCDGTFTGGGNDTGGFSGGDRNDNTNPVDPASGTINGPGQSDANPPFNIPNETRGDVVVDYGSDNPELYVPARIYYNGEDSGHDALFTFYIQRLKPAPENKMREIIQAKGHKVSSENTLERVCRCGKKSQFDFFWRHKHGRSGTLSSAMYDRDRTLQGDWIVSDVVSDRDWYEGNLKGAPQGIGSMFFGADTENPTAFLGMNKEGNGFLRTWHFHPNSLPFFATKEHRWDSRTDMRIALTCEIDRCPEDQRNDTELFFRQHFSHSPAWKLP